MMNELQLILTESVSYDLDTLINFKKDFAHISMTSQEIDRMVKLFIPEDLTEMAKQINSIKYYAIEAEYLNRRLEKADDDWQIEYIQGDIDKYNGRIWEIEQDMLMIIAKYLKM